MKRLQHDADVGSHGHPAGLVRLAHSRAMAIFAVLSIAVCPLRANAQSDDFSPDKTLRLTAPRIAGMSGTSINPSVSTDGRFVVFETDSKNLLGTTTTNVRHIVLLDRQVNAFELISQSTAGAVANGNSSNATISKNGRYVSFESIADNLGESVADTPPAGTTQVYVRDRFIGRTYLISRADGFAGAPGDDNSGNSSINGTGQFVAFESNATNLLPPDCPADTNGVQDIYARNGAINVYQTRRASVGPGFHGSGLTEFNLPSFNPFITDDGSKIAFSTATKVLFPDDNNALDVYVSIYPPTDCNVIADSLTRISNNFNRIQAANGASDKPVISADGRYIAFESTANDIVPLSADTNTVKDVFIHDTKFEKNLRCNVTADGPDGDADPDQAVGGDSENAYLASSGRFLVFESRSTNLGATNSNRNIYWANVTFADSGEPLRCSTKLVTVGNGAGADVDAFNPVVSGDGNLVFFDSLATTLVTGDTDNNAVADVFLANRQACTSQPGVDSDLDGTTNCLDQCPFDSSKVTDLDSDGDGTPDCADGCSSNPNKSSPGACGCSTLDTDTDADGTPDCSDSCDSDPAKVLPLICGCNIAETDSDQDGTPDCNDLCDNDRNKVTPQLCGCGVAETPDTDGDGTADCNDACPLDPNSTLPDQCPTPTPTATPSGPTPTLTPTVTLTPTRTPTPTATPDPVMQRPAKPRVSVNGNRVTLSFQDFSSFGLPVVYEVLFRSENLPRDRKKDFIFRTEKRTLTRRVRPGAYRVAYRLVLDGRGSPYSPLSKRITVSR